MHKVYTVLTPLPQLKLKPKSQIYDFEPGLSMRILKPRLRRRLLDIAKQKNYSEDLLMLLVHSESVFCAEIPHPSPWRENAVLSGTYYSAVATEILKKIFDCLLLFDWVPAPLLNYCWYLAASSNGKIDINSLKLLQPEWKYIDTFYNIDWRSPSVEPVNITLGCIGLKEYWYKLSVLCQIEQLNATFTNRKKLDGYVQAGREYMFSMMEEYLKARYGKDVTIERNATEIVKEEDISTRKNENTTQPIIQINEKLQIKWLLEGINKTFWNKLDKLGTELHKGASGNRFIRAFQFFTNAFRISNPHRFVAFTTCLETLFCKELSEITFQLASRIAWLLSPKNSSERVNTFDQVKYLYNLRSKIVHGAKFCINKLEQAENDLVSLIRRIFLKILSTDDIYQCIFDKDSSLWDKYLDRLNL